MNSVQGTAALPAVGFPIRTFPDQSLLSGSPRLFAASHVLLRLLSPRHPSCALCSLVISLLSPDMIERIERPRSSAVRLITTPFAHQLPTNLRICSFQRSQILSGADRDRTDDIQLAKLALSQLSYGPHPWCLAMVGLDRFELSTPRLSSVCSNQLSYRPSSRPSAPGLSKNRSLGPSKPSSKATRTANIV